MAPTPLATACQPTLVTSRTARMTATRLRPRPVRLEPTPTLELHRRAATPASRRAVSQAATCQALPCPLASDCPSPSPWPTRAQAIPTAATSPGRHPVTASTPRPHTGGPAQTRLTTTTIAPAADTGTTAAALIADRAAISAGA